jgi:hypothetical protein
MWKKDNHSQLNQVLILGLLITLFDLEKNIIGAYSEHNITLWNVKSLQRVSYIEYDE